MKPLVAVAFFVCFVFSSVAPIHAEWPSIQAPQQSSGVMQKFLNGLRKPGAQHHRTASSPPLPRPRPAELPREATKLNEPASEVAPASESAPIDPANALTEAIAPVEAHEPAAELAPASGLNEGAPKFPPSANPNEAEAPVPIND
jgi:hypothetical protein